MTDRRRASSRSGQEENPFAPPPEDRPDQPWRPRLRQGDGDTGHDGDGAADGQGDGRGDGRGDDRPPAPWGSQWSRNQPRRHEGGGFGEPPRRGEGGASGRGRHRAGPRWDPSDPAQRRARIALLAGMWGLFFALFDLTPLALLLGALALYWGVSALRMRPRDTAAAGRPAGPQPAGAPPGGRAPQRGPAVAGLVTGGMALFVVAVTFTTQLVYQDYFHCVDDALTRPARERCDDLLPPEVRPLLEGRGD